MSTTTKKKSGKKPVFIIIGIVLAVLIIAIVGISAVLNNLIKNAGLTVDAAHPVYQDISSDVTTSGTISSANITTYTGAINATINVIANVTIPPIYNPKAAINTKMIPLISLCLNINLYSSKSAVASIIVFDRLY